MTEPAAVLLSNPLGNCLFAILDDVLCKFVIVVEMVVIFFVSGPTLSEIGGLTVTCRDVVTGTPTVIAGAVVETRRVMVTGTPTVALIEIVVVDVAVDVRVSSDGIGGLGGVTVRGVKMGNPTVAPMSGVDCFFSVINILAVVVDIVVLISGGSVVSATRMGGSVGGGVGGAVGGIRLSFSTGIPTVLGRFLGMLLIGSRGENIDCPEITANKVLTTSIYEDSILKLLLSLKSLFK